MFVIVKEPEGRILLLSKGADRLVLHLITDICQTFAHFYDFLIIFQCEQCDVRKACTN
jgi:hypothetical protein